jgi:hypothetical protein
MQRVSFFFLLWRPPSSNLASERLDLAPGFECECRSAPYTVHTKSVARHHQKKKREKGTVVLFFFSFLFFLMGMQDERRFSLILRPWHWKKKEVEHAPPHQTFVFFVICLTSIRTSIRIRS